MPNLPKDITSYHVNKVALGGICTFDDPKDIDITECVDIENMQFDDGFISPRGGSFLHLSKPSGEDASAFQMLIATNSNGTDFNIANYGTSFYLEDSANRQWIKLNQSYSPSSSGIYYGSSNWNAGYSDDRFYFGNGNDSTMKWVMAYSQLSASATSSATSISLSNSASFPARLQVGNPSISIASPAVISLSFPHGLSAGDIVTFSTTGELPSGITESANYYVISGGLTSTSFQISVSNGGSAVITGGTQSGVHTVFTKTIPIIVQNGASAISLKYTSNSGNVLSLTSSIGADVPSGSTVTMPILQMQGMPKGKIFTVFQNDNLVIANKLNFENAFAFSAGGNPETFVPVGSTVGDALEGTLIKGKGGIIGIDNFGEYLIFEKQDILMRFQFQYSSDGATAIPIFTPIINGDGVGPVNPATKINYMNTLYYTTTTQGIIAFNPQTTGTQTTSELKVLSQKIQNYVVKVLNFTNGRTASFNQKLFFANAVPLLNDVPSTINNGIIMYDLLRGVWTRYSGWNVADIKEINKKLYYLSLNDGAMYECFVDYQDAQGETPYEYDVSFTTKRFDLDQPERLSRKGYVYIQGYISLTTKFYVDIMYNENGSLGKQTYLIDGSNSKIVQNNLTGGLSAYPFAVPLLGGFNLRTMQNSQQPAFFRCYLETSQAFRPHNIQLKLYSVEIGSYWGINNITMMQWNEQSVNNELVLGPTLDAPIVL